MAMFRRALMFLWVTSMATLWSAVVAAADAPWLAEMPKPAEVIGKIRGADPYDAAARQYAAFQVLSSIRGSMIGARAYRNETTPAERALAVAYGGELTRIQTALIESLPPAERTGKDSRRAQWFSLASRYQFDAAFKDELLGHFFSKQFRSDLAQAEARGAANAKAGAEMLKPRPSLPSAQQGDAGRERTPSGVREFIEQVVPAQWRWAVNPWPWLAVFGALFLFGAGRSVAPFQLATDDVFDLRVGARRYTLNHAVGLVTDLQRWGEATTVPTTQTVTHSDGSQSTVHGSYTRVTNRIQIMLKDASGRTQDIQLYDMELAVAPGQGFAAVWAVPRGKSAGPFVMLHNHDLGRTQFMPAIERVVKMPFWPAVPLAAAALCTALPWWFAGVAFLGYGVAIAIVNAMRVRRFKTDYAPRILAALPRPPEGIALPGGGMLSPG